MDTIGDYYNVISGARKILKKKDDVKSEKTKILIELLAGGISGTAANIICHPFDTIKTIYQNNNLSYWAITRGIYNNGIPSFWKGFLAPSLNFGVVNSACFCSYYYTKKKFDPNDDSDSITINAAIFSAFVQLIPWVPSEIIKIQMQKSAHLKVTQKVTLHSTIYHIYKHAGFCGFYKGILVQASRDIPNNIAYFLTYSKVRKYLNTNFEIKDEYKAFIGGFVTGFVAWVVVIPMDLLKTRIQTNTDKNVMEFFRKVFINREVSLFHGSFMSTFRSCAGNALIFVIYEALFPELDRLIV